MYYLHTLRVRRTRRIANSAWFRCAYVCVLHALLMYPSRTCSCIHFIAGELGCIGLFWLGLVLRFGPGSNEACWVGPWWVGGFLSFVRLLVGVGEGMIIY